MAYDGTASFRGGPTIPSTGPAIATSAENRHVAVEVRDIRAVRDYLERQAAELRKAVVISDRRTFLRPGAVWKLFRIHRNEERLTRNPERRNLVRVDLQNPGCR